MLRQDRSTAKAVSLVYTVGELTSAHTPKQKLSQTSSLTHHNQHKITLNSHYCKGKPLPMTTLAYQNYKDQTILTMKGISIFGGSDSIILQITCSVKKT